MKTIMVSALLLGMCLSGLAQKDAPEAAKKNFASLYPKVTNVKWGKEGVNYEAEFKDGTVPTSLLYDAKGTLLETEVGLNVTQLPQAVRDYIAKNLAGSKIKEAAMIKTAKGETKYEAEISGKDYLFDASGKLLSVEKE